MQRDDAFRADDRMQDDSFAGYLGDLLPFAHSEELPRKKAMEPRKGIPEENEDLRLVQTAVELAQRVLGGSTVKAMMNKFRSMGVVDPGDQEHHTQITYGSNGFAVVALARNPWSKDGRYPAVVCGGIHGPGTAAALRELLTRPERFENHPLGAVLEVKLRLDLDWPTRFDRATVSSRPRSTGHRTCWRTWRRPSPPDRRSAPRCSGRCRRRPCAPAPSSRGAC